MRRAQWESKESDKRLTSGMNDDLSQRTHKKRPR